MPKIYCPHDGCYKATIYESNKPNFCSFCGKPYINATKSNIQPTPSVKSTQVVIAQQNEEIVSVPQIDRLEYKLESDNLRPNRERIKIDGNKDGVMAHKSTSKTKGKPLSKKQFQEQWADPFKKNVRQTPTEL